jgi:hypothetical protein
LTHEDNIKNSSLLGVTDCVPLVIEITHPMDVIAVVQVRWILHRRNRQPVYDFTAVYTLARAEDGLRIVAIAHDELPKMQAALKRSNSGG